MKKRSKEWNIFRGGVIGKEMEHWEGERKGAIKTTTGMYGGSVLLCDSGCGHHFFAQLLVLVEVAMPSWDNGVHLRRIHLLQSTLGQGRPTDKFRLGHRGSGKAFAVGGHGV